jgi:hypothetical protein
MYDFVFRSALAVASSDFCFSPLVNANPVVNSVYMFIKKHPDRAICDSIKCYTRQIMISLESECDF